MTRCWHQLNVFFLPWKSKQRLLQQLISYFDVGGVDSNVPSIHLGMQFLTYSTPPLHLLHVPSLSNVGAIVARAATHAQLLSPGGGMPPIFVIFLSSLESSWSFWYCRLWRWHVSPKEFKSAPAYILTTGGRNNSCNTTNGRPEAFDA